MCAQGATHDQHRSTSQHTTHVCLSAVLVDMSNPALFVCLCADVPSMHPTGGCQPKHESKLGSTSSTCGTSSKCMSLMSEGTTPLSSTGACACRRQYMYPPGLHRHCYRHRHRRHHRHRHLHSSPFSLNYRFSLNYLFRLIEQCSSLFCPDCSRRDPSVFFRSTLTNLPPLRTVAAKIVEIK